MSAHDLLSRLEKVCEKRPQQWMASCPAHDDKNPSLSIRELDDGRVLVHCFGGCESEDVLASAGLSFSDVMPERIGVEHFYKPVRNRISPRDALAQLDHESLVVAFIGADFLEHKKIDEPTWGRLAQAVNRINHARAESAPRRMGR